MAKKIAVIGDRESILGYRTLGFDARPAENAEEAAKVLIETAKEDYAVIYITEQLASLIPEEIAKFKDTPLPAIILIPGKEGSLGLGMKGVKAAVERAVGADILG